MQAPSIGNTTSSPSTNYLPLPPAANQQVQIANAMQNQYALGNKITDLVFTITVIYLLVLSIQEYLKQQLYSSIASGLSAVVIASCYAYLRRYTNITNVMNRLIEEIERVNTNIVSYIATTATLDRAISAIRVDTTTGRSIHDATESVNRIDHLLNQLTQEQKV